MKNLLIYLLILTSIGIPQIIKTNKNIKAVKSNAPTSVVTAVKPQKRGLPYKHIPEPQTKQETAIETIVECFEEEAEPDKIYLGVFELTAYCSCRKCCGIYAENRPIDENGKEIVFGSTGDRLYQGVSIAVDPNVIPYGSMVEIDGKTYISHDCGSAIKGNRIDVYFENHNEALAFGRQWQDVYLVIT